MNGSMLIRKTVKARRHFRDSEPGQSPHRLSLKQLGSRNCHSLQASCDISPVTCNNYIILLIRYIIRFDGKSKLKGDQNDRMLGSVANSQFDGFGSTWN
jgi:hypothetical protein